MKIEKERNMRVELSFSYYHEHKRNYLFTSKQHTIQNVLPWLTFHGNRNKWLIIASQKEQWLQQVICYFSIKLINNSGCRHSLE